MSGVATVQANREPEAARTEFPTRRALRLDRRDEVAKRARRAVQEHCEGRVDDDVNDQARLVASELVTNAFEHCTSGIVTLDVSIAGEAVVLTVTSPGSNDTRGIPPVNAWRVSPPTYPSGRGLGMIRRIADEVIVDAGSGPDGRHWQVVSVRLTPESVGQRPR
ncbi:histidine kinase-like protein [Ilumatobacter fluminis]|uniref:Histidine kinase-like protein n=1 Tax=Ilumatobacter fluminis TaxID=467091 RepID=A0A4R7I4I1_9ACTN|nr:ATP-binding protein [Ilumatobacter fluminis]TDT17859.1 histidine kinase-like protein [Ilumatobacter fluminis]